METRFVAEEAGARRPPRGVVGDVVPRSGGTVGSGRPRTRFPVMPSGALPWRRAGAPRGAEAGRDPAAAAAAERSRERRAGAEASLRP